VSQAKQFKLGPDDPFRPFEAMSEAGILWWINRTAFHPQGLALALVKDDDGVVLGWDLLQVGADEAEPYSYPEDVDRDGYRRWTTFLLRLTPRGLR
jgi:hypothetical protein